MSARGRHWTGTRRRRHRRRRIRSGRPAGRRAPAGSAAHRRRAGFRAPCRPLGGAISAPLAAAYAEVEAPAGVKAAVDRRLFSRRLGCGPAGDIRRAGPAVQPRLLARPRRGGARRAGALYRAALHQSSAGRSAAASGWSPRLPPTAATSAISPSTTTGANDIGLSHVAGDRAQGRDFELWVIEGQQAPVSLGVIPVGATRPVCRSSDAMRAKMVSGARVRDQPRADGGSPTGQPTGPVVAAGDLRAI